MPSSCSALVCLGHSHVRCVGEAALARDLPLVALDFWHFKPAVIDTREGARFVEAIARHLHGDLVFSLIGGTAHHKTGLVVHPRRFDFVLPAAPELPLDERAEIIPFDCVRQILLAATEPYLKLMRILRASCAGRIVHIEAPPVLADEGPLRRDVPWMFFQGRRTISPRYLRYKLWRLHSEIVSGFCHEHGMFFLPHPAGAVDDEGFLRAEHYANAMHVNSSYGALVLEQMESVA